MLLRRSWHHSLNATSMCYDTEANNSMVPISVTVQSVVPLLNVDTICRCLKLNLDLSNRMFCESFVKDLSRICLVHVDTSQRNKMKEREYSNIKYPQMTNSRSKSNMASSRSSSV